MLTIEHLAQAGSDQAEKALLSLTIEQAEALLHQWEFFARPAQLIPGTDHWHRAVITDKRIEIVPASGQWQTWLFLGGRGTGKTRGGAEGVRALVRRGYGRLAFVAPTAADARDVMIEGPSGILSCSWERDRDHKGNLVGRPKYQPSKRRVIWANGARAMVFSAEKPDRLRGPQHDAGWLDEITAMAGSARLVWNNYQFGLRMGTNPVSLVTGTPKPMDLLLEIIRDEKTAITRGTTYDNRANLARGFFDRVLQAYEGTRIGRQEIGGELLLEAEGALWTRESVEACIVSEPPAKFVRVVVGVDPATKSTSKKGDRQPNETGIVTVGKGSDKRGYVLADASGRLRPSEWAERAVACYEEFGADCIVAEGNQGGEMVRHTIQSASPNIPVRIVHASRGKQARAEPVSHLYEQGRAHHVGSFPLLEDQMVTWEPETGMDSPDRIDALVWAFSALFFSGRDRKVGAAPVVYT